jgi:hypothetical protein
MPEPLFENFEINTLYIWDFERDCLLNPLIEFKDFSEQRIMETLVEKVRNIAISKSRPFTTYEGYLEGGKDTRHYYESKINQLYRASDFSDYIRLEFFFSRDDGYSYRVNHEILSKEGDFAYWFALKLRQYELGIAHIYDFLDHHLSYSFYNHSPSYLNFLTIQVLRQYHNIFFSDRVRDIVKEYITKLRPFVEHQITEKAAPEQKSTKAIGKRPKARKEFNSYRLTVLQKKPAYLMGNSTGFYHVFHLLIQHQFIKADPDLDFDRFKKIFSGRGVSKSKRIIWLDDNIYLKLFVRYLLQTKKIESMGNENWRTTVKCFLDKNGNEFKTSQLQYANGGKEEKVKLVYSIIDRLEDVW